MAWSENSFSVNNPMVPVAQMEIVRLHTADLGPTPDAVAIASRAFTALDNRFSAVVKHADAPAMARTVVDIQSRFGDWQVREFVPTGDPNMFWFRAQVDGVPMGRIAVVGFGDRNDDKQTLSGIEVATPTVARGIARALSEQGHQLVVQEVGPQVTLLRDRNMGDRWKQPERPEWGPID
jgi:hypothetical protein